MATRTGKALIGEKVYIKGQKTYYAGHWGFIKSYDGKWYHVGGGSFQIGSYPVFTRREFEVVSMKKYNRKVR